MNVPKIKGTHGAMKSGILAAEALMDALMDEKNDGKETGVFIHIDFLFIYLLQ